MSQKKLLIFDIFLILYALACPFIMQISKGTVQYGNYDYYYFKAADQTQIAVTILSIVLITFYGFVFGLNKKFNRIPIFIGVCLLLKIAAFLSDIVSPAVSELIWTAYTAPVYPIYENIDIFIFAFYETIFVIAFLLGFLAKKVYYARMRKKGSAKINQGN